jgi:hypothetical protein
MPFMRFNWATHSARCSRLTMEERGFFDAVRCELWSVVGCRLPLDLLRTRLRIAPKSRNSKTMESLLALGLLRQDSEGRVFDEVQAHEFDTAMSQAAINTANGRKGGRPRKVPQESLTGVPSGDPQATGGDF